MPSHSELLEQLVVEPLRDVTAHPTPSELTLDTMAT